MLKIGDFSKLCRVTIKALRYYDEVGLLKPGYINEENGYRYYRPEQLETVSRILSFKDMGFSLEEIAVMIQSTVSSHDVLSMLRQNRSRIESSIHAEKQKLARLNAYIKGIEEEVTMISVEIKELPEVIVASMRLTIPDYEAFNQAYPAMGEKMRAHGDVCAEPAYCFTIYHDGEYKEKDIDVEICEAVQQLRDSADGITYKTMPAVRTAACIYHKGPYSTIGSSYAEVFKWIEKNGYETSGHPRESYIDGCWNKEDPAEWLTEIQVPIRKK